MSDPTELRLRRLEDRASIRHLFRLYRRHLDARDFSGVSALFARMGEWHGGSGYAKTPAGICSMLQANLPPSPPAPGPTTFHLVSNEQIVLDGDRATAESTWVVIIRSEGDQPTFLSAGRYRDELIREDGHWRFLSRVAPLEIPARPLAKRP